jgi:Cu(I)/Ag(I) efflux system periplasmic protein CusF
MKRLTTVYACLLLGAAPLAFGQAGGMGAKPMSKASCEQMMRDHSAMKDQTAMMGKERGGMKGHGMMGKDHAGMMGKDSAGTMMMDMPKECAEMMGTGAMAMKDTGKSHSAVGVVKKVDVAAAKVTLQHEPVQALGWPAMTMPFTLKDKAALEKLKPGQKVEFDFVQEGSSYVIGAIR